MVVRMVGKLGRIGCPEIRVGLCVMPYGNGREVEVRRARKEAGGAGGSHTKLWVPSLLRRPRPGRAPLPSGSTS
jgi:hypothetical protein